jgi:hypothetical protein
MASLNATVVFPLPLAGEGAERSEAGGGSINEHALTLNLSAIHVFLVARP